METPINWRMVKHPLNWVTITLMVLIAAAIGHSVLSLLGIEPSTSAVNNVPAGQSPGQVNYADLGGTSNIPAS